MMKVTSAHDGMRIRRCGARMTLIKRWLSWPLPMTKMPMIDEDEYEHEEQKTYVDEDEKEDE